MPGKPLLDFIIDQFAVCHFPNTRPFVERLLESGNVLLLFDGLDEVTSAAEFAASLRGRGDNEPKLAPRFRIGTMSRASTCRIAAVDYSLEHSLTYLGVAGLCARTGREVCAFLVLGRNRQEGSATLASRMLYVLGAARTSGDS